ncbi:hypothetical protein ACFLTI_08745 [Bacteroidota bacterium]
MKKVIICLFCTMFLGSAIFAQEIQTQTEMLRNNALKVFIDCSSCDMDYIKREIPFINYVRDRKEAQVHLMVTTRETGSGGKEYKIDFIGLNDFEGDNETVIYNSGPNDTSDEIRAGRTHNLKMGLIKYVIKTPLNNFITIDYDLAQEEEEKIVEDKWKSWVFEIDIQGDFQGEETQENIEFDAGFSAEKVTPEWRIEFDGEFDMEIESFKTEEDEPNYESNSTNFEHYLIKSLSDHWSAGEHIILKSSTYRNNKFSYSFFPAIEYNIFPYKESSRKQLRFNYGLGYEFVNYRDTTIYGKMQEGQFKQMFVVALGLKQPWGTVSSSIRASSYLYDLSKNNFEFTTTLRWRIYKGLSFTISGGYSIIHDQLSIPRKDATQAEILLSLREMESQYNYECEIGLSYTFGAIYNNVVNPRFGK